jgi:hypothetical protein
MMTRTRSGEVGGVVPDAGHDFLAGECTRDEDDPAIDAAEAVAEVGQGRDVDFDLLMVGELAGAELGGVGLAALRCIGGFFFGHVSKLCCPPGRSSLNPVSGTARRLSLPFGRESCFIPPCQTRSSRVAKTPASKRSPVCVTVRSAPPAGFSSPRASAN